MLSIQEVGTQIFEKKPQSFYVMNGVEYGIKLKYIDMIAELYGGRKEEIPKVADILSIMSKKRIIPLQPTVYIVRYDDEFMSSLNETTAKKIASCKIVGTIVAIYSNPKYTSKLDKYLPQYSVSIDAVNKNFILKYLKTDFPDLPDRFVTLACNMCTDYYHGKIICNAMQTVKSNALYELSDIELKSFFGVDNVKSDAEVRVGVASRNFAYLLSVLEDYEGQLDRFVYAILSTVIDIEKLLRDKRVQSDIREYVSGWTLEDVYNMFMNAYGELMKLRSISQNPENSIIYLISLLQFSRIPSIEAMQY